MKKYWPRIIATIFITSVLYKGLLAYNHTQKLSDLRKKLETLKEEEKNLQARINDFEQKIHRINVSKEEMEKKAREEFGLTRKGELIYVFNEEERDRHNLKNKP